MLKKFLVSSLLLGAVCEAHVALTFPPARKYDLDFLDTFRTQFPCGMAKGDVVTSIEAGKELKVTWHLGYPHRGGFKIQLFDPKERLIQDLTPNGLYVGTEIKETQEYTVQIPETITCQGCILRLERQALEWGAKYRFQSCADVDIVKKEAFQMSCSGHGRPSGGSCQCDRTYFGDRCQYKDDCVDGSDCSDNAGDCIDTKGTSLPRRQCFCQHGFFGLNCEKRSSVHVSSNFTDNIRTYQKVETRGVDFYWKILPGGEEFEGVIVGKGTTSYVAVGWRPQDETKSCQAFPSDALVPKGSDFHAMDCNDMVIGSAYETRSRVEDYYTRDRSTPRRDSFYGGSSDLTAALGWVQNGNTYVLFRKRRYSEDPTDHDFNGKLQLIWAHGQDGQEFYGRGELKYHGGNRGKVALEVNSASNLSTSGAAYILAIALLKYLL